MPTYLVFGASLNPARHSNKAVKSLVRHNHSVIAIGLREGTILDVPVITGMPVLKAVDTILLYIGTRNQPPFYDYLVKLNPRRVIFNPGTENQEFQDILEKNRIEVVLGCALVMISSGQL